MRTWSPREFNHLTKYGFDPFVLANEVEQDIPVEYISGKAEFLDKDFFVTPDVLIPRLETEHIINLASKFSENFLSRKETLKVVDIGTGSGVIGITLASKLQEQRIEYEIYLSDISPKALVIADKNIKQFFPENSSIKLLLSDLLSKYPAEVKFDLIIANLPYIPTDRIDNLEKSVKDYEPRLALDGGEDGLNLIRELLNQAKTKLKPNGLVLLEVDDTHIDTSDFDEWNIQVSKDENEKTRYWSCSLK